MNIWTKYTQYYSSIFVEMRCCPLKWTFCFLRSQPDWVREPGPTTSITPQGVVEPSRFSRSGEPSAKTTTETAQEMSNAERKMAIVMRVERPYEGFMFMFPVVPASTPAIYIFRLGRRPRTRRRHSGRRNFKPKIPGVSEDNYMRKPSGNSSARPGGLQGRKRVDTCIRIRCFERYPDVIYSGTHLTFLSYL